MRDVVPTKWSISGREPEVAAEIARDAASRGFVKMKVKVGIDADGDIARVRAVREAVGDKIILGVDANGGWKTPENAVGAINMLAEFQIDFVEQPVPAFDLEGMAEVRKSVKFPIIADESVYTLQDAKNLSHANAADVFSIYVGKAGGIGPARDICNFAQHAGLACTIGSNLEMGIGSAAMIHLAIASDRRRACRTIRLRHHRADVLRGRTANGAGVDLGRRGVL